MNITDAANGVFPENEDDDERLESICDRCGGSNPVWFAPNGLWNLVLGGPEAQSDPGGFLCPVCFIKKADASEHLPLVSGWKLQPAEFEDHMQAARIHALIMEIVSLRQQITPLGDSTVAELKAGIAKVDGNG